MTWLRFLEFALSVSLQVALVILLCYGLGRFVSAGQRCRLWTICYVLILLLVGAAITLPHPRLFSQVPAVATPHWVGLLTLESQLGKTCCLVWLAGSCVMLVRTAVGMVHSHRLVTSCQPIDPELLTDCGWEGLMPECDGGLGRNPELTSSATPRLLRSQTATSPFCWQFHHPCIVLPEYLLAMDHDQLRLVIRHELEHLRTGHPLQLFVQRCAESLFWFHPLVWWASRQVTLARETACDTAVVNSPAEVAKYLRTLLAIGERSTLIRNWALQPVSFLGTRSLIAARTSLLVAMARGTAPRQPKRFMSAAARTALVAGACLAMVVWCPITGSGLSPPSWSPWPAWSARVLHDFGIHVRDFETSNSHLELAEWIKGEFDFDDDVVSISATRGLTASPRP